MPNASHLFKKRNIPRFSLHMGSNIPTIIVYPYCIAPSIFEQEKRRKLRGNKVYKGYMQNMENLIKNYAGRLLFIESELNSALLGRLIKDFKREGPYDIFMGEKDKLLEVVENEDFVGRIRPFKKTRLNVAGGDLDVSSGGDGDFIELNGSLGLIAEALLFKRYRLNALDGLTFDRTRGNEIRNKLVEY